MGWLVGLGVLLITLGVVCGLIGVGIAAKRKQRYRIDEPTPSLQKTNAATARLKVVADANSSRRRPRFETTESNHASNTAQRLQG